MLVALDAIANHTPWTRRFEGQSRDLAVYVALQRLFVDGPRRVSGKSKELPDNVIRTLQPLLAHFGPDAADIGECLPPLFDAVIAAAAEREPEDGGREAAQLLWTKLLKTIRPARQRLGVVGQEYGSQRDKTVHNLASLLRLSLIDGEDDRSGFDLPLDEPRSSPESQPPTRTRDDRPLANAVAHAPTDSPVTITVTVSPGLFTELASSPTPPYQVELSGNLDSWYLSMMRSKYGEPEPETSVKVIVREETAEGWRLTDPSGYFETRLHFESWVGRWFGRTPEGAVIEICRLAIQYCDIYYNRPELLKGLVEAFFDQRWIRWGHTLPFYAVYVRRPGGYQIAVHLAIPEEWLQAKAESHGISHWRTGAFLAVFDWVTELDDDQISSMALPGIIAEWMMLQERGKPEVVQELEIEEFLRPSYWQIVLD